MATSDSHAIATLQGARVVDNEETQPVVQRSAAHAEETTAMVEEHIDDDETWGQRMIEIKRSQAKGGWCSR